MQCKKTHWGSVGDSTQRTWGIWWSS